MIKTYMYVLNEDDVQRVERDLSLHLSSEDVARVQKIRHVQSRKTTLMGRVLLRRILAAHIGGSPLAFQFSIGEKGKPFLTHADVPWHFNVSHSGDCILVGLTQFGPIGVDVELIKPRGSVNELAEYVMAPKELTHYQSLPPRQAQDYFFSSWVLKESYVKCLGVGISMGLKNIHTQSLPACILSDNSVCAQFLSAPDDYNACMVVQLPDEQPQPLTTPLVVAEVVGVHQEMLASVFEI